MALTEPEAHLLGLTGWPVSFQDLPALEHCSYKLMPPCTALYMVLEASSGPRAVAASTLPVKPALLSGNHDDF